MTSPLQLGVIVVYGVDRDGQPPGAERPFGDLCIRSFVLHASMEYSAIIMSGACAYEGKTYRAIASSKPGDRNLDNCRSCFTEYPIQE